TLLTLLRHLDKPRPLARKTFARPLMRAVEAYLAAEANKVRRMVELVNRPARNKRIPPGVAIGTDSEKHIPQILHIHVLLENENKLRKHKPAQPPNRVHNFERMPRISLANLDKRHIVKAGFDGQIDIQNLRNSQTNKRQK